MVTLTASIAALVAAAATLLYTWRVAVRCTASVKEVSRQIGDTFDYDWKHAVDAHLELLDSELEMGVKRVKRTEDRIRAVVRSALKKLDEAGIEHPALEAEAEELQLDDGEGGPDSWVQPLPAGLEDGSEGNRPSGIPGLTEHEIAQMKARRSS